MHSDDLANLKSWFLSQKRDLPWRKDSRKNSSDNPSPYAVWVSEIMLQQTQVQVVIPYFLRWMERFPTINSLAQAPLELVLKEWEGLGYYSRARNLHEGARYVAAHHHGVLPDTEIELAKIKGLGVYTIGAILSFAFHKRKAAVDGNVMRVLARYYCIEDDISQAKVQKKIRNLSQDLLPPDDSWTISEALIELGAMVCARKAKCMDCPLFLRCGARLKGKTLEIPLKSPKKPVTYLYRLVPILFCQNKFLVKRGKAGIVMADLYEFLKFETDQKIEGLEEQKKVIEKMLLEEFSLNATWKHALPQIKHSFTRYRACLTPHIYLVKDIKDIKGFEWMTLEELNALPFSSGHRKILENLRTGS